MTTTSVQVIDTNGIGPAARVVGGTSRRIFVRRVAAVGGGLYGLGWLIAARQLSALSAYECAWATAMALAGFSVLSFQRAVGRLPERQLPQRAWTQLLTAMVLHGLGGGGVVCLWQARWALEWRSTLGYQLGWFAALITALAVYVIVERVERETLTERGRA